MANSQFLIKDKTQQKLRIAEKRSLILEWLKSEGHSNSEILSQVIGLKRQGADAALKAMMRDGLVRSEELGTGYKLETIYGLTPHAAALMSDFVNNQLVNYFEPGRVSAWTLQHSLSIQRLRLYLESQGWTSWKSDRQCKREGHHGQWLKVPDAIATNPDGQTVAIEVERSYKSLKRYPDIIAGYLQMLKLQQVQAVNYYCVGQCTSTKMQQIFQSIKQIKINGQLVALESRHYQQFNFINFTE